MVMGASNVAGAATNAAGGSSNWTKYLPGIGGIASGIAGLFGHQKNPADVANGYINQIPEATKGYYEPYDQAGRNMLGGLQDQYNQSMNNPGGKFNEIGQNFQQSPGFQFALQQALQGGNHAAAAGGMAGSPMHEQQNMGLATDLANQDYYNYMQGATGIYGQGLQGAQGLANMGANAANNQANTVAQTLAQQAQYGYQGQDWKNNNKTNAIGSIAGGLGAFAGL